MKKKTSFFRKFLLGFFAFIAALVIIIYAFDVNYIYKALIYQNPSINDLDLFLYRKIEAPAQKKDWPLAKDYNAKLLTPTLEKLCKDYKAAALLIIQNDSIKYERYWDQTTTSSLTNSFSVAKSIVGILIGVAIEEGAIKSIDQPVSDYLPEFKEGKKAKITIRHLLEMSSGLDFMESYSSPFNYTTEAYYGQDLSKLIHKLKVIEEPGTVHRYKSGDPQVLQMILKKATGKDLSAYASEKLWKKIGASQDAKWSMDHRDGDEKAYCCFYSDARDFARIGKLMLNKGNFDGTHIVSENWINESLKPVDLLGDDGKLYKMYGKLWWLINRHGEHIFYASGLNGQYIFGLPKENIIIVRLGHDRPSVRVHGHRIDIITYIDEVLKMYGTSKTDTFINKQGSLPQ